MSIRVAFAGMRHVHIFDLVDLVRNTPGLELVAVCEEDSQARDQLAAAGKIQITHHNFDRMLAEVPCDVVAVGDCYGRRGSILLRALKAGKHVIADKPLCTSLDELNAIERLAASKHLSVGCQLDTRSYAAARTARRIIAIGEIGRVQTVNFSAQHPLLFGQRPDWYFAPGMHGGTINDIFIHAADAIPWMTQQSFREVLFARTWNPTLPQHPDFQVAGQLVLRLDNDGGVMGDVSYLAPTRCGYVTPTYWRYTIHGECGLIEFELSSKKLLLASHCDAQPRLIDVDAPVGKLYLQEFLDELAGKCPQAGALTTADVLTASRIALQAQLAADRNRGHVAL